MPRCCCSSAGAGVFPSLVVKVSGPLTLEYGTPTVGAEQTDTSLASYCEIMRWCPAAISVFALTALFFMYTVQIITTHEKRPCSLTIPVSGPSCD